MARGRDTHGHAGDGELWFESPDGDPQGIVIPIADLAKAMVANALDGAHRLNGPVEVLCWTSAVTFFWEGGRPVIGREDSDALGREVVERLARAPGRYERMLLRGIATLAEEPVRSLAAERAGSLEVIGRRPVPGWLRTVGGGRAQRAGLIESPDPDDGTIALFDLGWPCGTEATLGVFVDPRLGGKAKHILVGPPLRECLEDLEDPVEGRVFVETPAVEVAAVIRAAIATTEAGCLEEVGDSYKPHRALLRFQLNRIDAEAVPRNRAA